MLLVKDNITIDVEHPADIRRYVAMGFKRPEELDAEANAEAIKAVNKSPATPSAKTAKPKGGGK